MSYIAFDDLRYLKVELPTFIILLTFSSIWEEIINSSKISDKHMHAWDAYARLISCGEYITTAHTKALVSSTS